MAAVIGGSIAPIGRVPPIRSIARHYRRAATRSTGAWIKDHSSTLSRLPRFAPRKAKKTVERVQLAKRLRVEKLKRIDGQVRIHEQTHMASLGAYARGGPRYIYVIGPDGKSYAAGGSVSVDLSAIPGDPKATIRKARMLRRAAYGPTQPSAQDMHIAAAAYRLEMEAHQELAKAEEKEQAEEKENQETISENGRHIILYA